MTEILELFAKRHSFYDISDKTPFTPDNIERIIKKCMELYPSSFNTQSARLLLLYGKEHHRFWALVESELLKNSPKDKAEAIKKRVASFDKGHGTILFCDDMSVVRALEKKMPLYADNFKNWSHQSNAILQFMIWSALADSNIGASMQHYNPLIDEAVKEQFDIPENWELVAQMPFGNIETEPQPHSFEDIDMKLIIKR